MTFVAEQAQSVQSLVDDVLQQGKFDVDSAWALRWLNERHRQMCARSSCFRKTVELGPTVDGQAEYTVPVDVIEIMEVLVAGYPYNAGVHTDLAAGQRGFIWLAGEGGLAIENDDAIGNATLSLFPTPKQGSAPEPGSPIAALVVARPPDLLITDDTTLKIPLEYVGPLVDGAIATGLKRVESRPDMASAFEATFNAACTELARAVNVRFRNSGPTVIRIAGITA